MPALIEPILTVDIEQLRAAADKETRLQLRALTEALAETVREAEKALEDKTREVAGGRLWRAWTSGIGPAKGRIARDPAGWIRLNGRREIGGRISRTYGAIESITTTGRISAQSGGFLAVPLPAAGSRGRDRWLTPGEWERRTGLRLRYVYRPGKPALLVVDEATTNGRTGSARPITRKRTAADLKRGFVRGAQTVPIFVLLPMVPFTAKFSIDGVVAPYRAALPKLVIAKATALRGKN